jgi:tRNA(Ile)-lysidine synthase
LRRDRHYQLRPRRGGERCQPDGRRHSQSLKKLLQEAGLPPWWRDRLPLLWCGDELAAVADLWICEGYAAAPGEAGWLLHWRRPGGETAASSLSQ